MRKATPTALILTAVGVAGFFVIGAVSGTGKRSTAVEPETPTPAAVAAPPPMNMVTAPARETPPISSNEGVDYLAIKAQSEEHLKALLKDDHGVRYQGVQTRLSTMDGKGIVAFCGQVNAKNAFGAYADFARFIASRSVAITEDQMTAVDFDQAWRRFCTDGVVGPQVWF